jgi:hydrogenase nickel incorporation protein HypB
MGGFGECDAAISRRCAGVCDQPELSRDEPFECSADAAAWSELRIDLPRFPPLPRRGGIGAGVIPGVAMADHVEIQAQTGNERGKLAHELRQRFDASGIFVVTLASAPGAGKTTLLEAVLKQMVNRIRAGVLVADPATSDDALLLAGINPAVKQINTGDAGYLSPEMVSSAIDGWIPPDLEILFIENVGNLVVPSGYDLGEHHRVVLMSAAQEADTPLKYPAIFRNADTAILSKMDLAKLTTFDLASARENLQKVNPGVEILETSTPTGHGIDEFLKSLESRLDHWRERLKGAAPV